MKQGLSLLLGELLDADGIDHLDCIDLQIVCPACKEPVFKGLREHNTPVGIHYLSHYKKDLAYSDDCEMRVSKITKEQRDSINSVARGQKLAYFLAVLKNEIIGVFSSATQAQTAIGQMIGKSPGIMLICDRVYKGWHAITSVMDYDAMFNDLIKEFRGNPPRTTFTISTQKRIAKDISLHLSSGLAFGSFRFLFCAAWMVLDNSLRNAIEIRSLQEFEVIMLNSLNALFLCGRGKADAIIDLLSQYIIPPPYSISKKQNLLNKLSADVAWEMMGILLLLPYFEMLKKQR